MNNLQYLLLIVLILTMGCLNAKPTKAQEPSSDLTLDMNGFIEKLLKNNEQLKIQENILLINKEKNTWGYQGLLPNLFLSGRYQEAINDSNLKFANPQQEDINVKGAGSQSINGSLNLSYTLFNGGGKNVTLKKIKNSNDLSYWQYLFNVESIILKGLNAYLNLVQQKLILDVRGLALKNSKDRLLRGKERYSFGSGSKIELFNAEINYNNDSVLFIQQLNNIETAKNEMKQLLNFSSDISFDVDSKIGIQRDLNYDSLISLTNKQNASIRINELSNSNQLLNINLQKSSFFPRLDLSASYGYNQSMQDGSFIAEQNSLGLTGQLSLRYDLFNGNRGKANYRIAKLQSQNQLLQSNENKRSIENQLNSVFNQYLTALIQLELQQLNQKTAQLSYEKSIESYSNGQMTGIELREAQLNLVQVGILMSNTLINAKRSELQLLLLSGQLFRRQ